MDSRAKRAKTKTARQWLVEGDHEYTIRMSENDVWAPMNCNCDGDFGSGTMFLFVFVFSDWWWLECKSL